KDVPVSKESIFSSYKSGQLNTFHKRILGGPFGEESKMPNVTQPISPAPSHYGSKGSFGPVFVVLAAIIVLAVVAYVIGRLCNRRVSR
ncbi:unnamed protein product, partial [Musa acuminata subsp. burmannicoides]